VIGKRVTRASIGFGAELARRGAEADAQGAYFDHTEPEDLVHFGLIPEFVGRLPLLVRVMRGVKGVFGGRLP
jgi:ATP-dependent Clp protease ATP-binding subunit ClpX